MPEKVTPHPEQGFIECLSTGKTSLEDYRGSLKEALRIRKDTGLDKILVDDREHSGAYETFPIHKFIGEIPPALRVALLISQKTLSENRFIETVSVNRGGNLRIFTDKDEALAWLKA